MHISYSNIGSSFKCMYFKCMHVLIFCNVSFPYYTCMRDNIIETRILTYLYIWPQVFAAPFFCGPATACHSRRAISSSIAVREWRYWRTRNLYHKYNTWQSSSAINPKIKRFMRLLLLLLFSFSTKRLIRRLLLARYLLLRL